MDTKLVTGVAGSPRDGLMGLVRRNAGQYEDCQFYVVEFAEDGLPTGAYSYYTDEAALSTEWGPAHE